MTKAHLVNRIDDPVDTWVTTDDFVLRIDEDDLKVLVGRILIDPVRIEHPQIGAPTADTFLGRGPEGTLVLELVHTLIRRFA